jgi:hypothetical protein
MTTTWTDPRLARWESALALLPPIFREAIGVEMAHRGLDRLILEDSWVYATEGHIAVRAPATAAIRAAVEAVPVEGKPFPHRIGVNLELPVAPDPAGLPEPTGGAPCPDCGGAGFLPARECDDCDGEGIDECECCGHEADCDSCGGKGSLPPGPCDDCHGEGVHFGEDADRGFAMDLGGFWVAKHFALMLRRHGVTRVFPAAVDPHKWPARFEGDGFEGAIMGVTPPKP